MYIKELQLIGFKSFQEKTTLRFAPGMNCIIGPNGCGKSNVLDALRWVLGEQSFSLLRCAKNEDLIFAGTARIPPVNFAEVRLILATEDYPELGSEVEIRRRYFRSGESEYYLNRQPCRLRDIQDLFLSAGIGTKAYSIFDLHQMREIIAGNIRPMVEEAATLAKFRETKEECERKLSLTQTDLTRLEDIIAERERVVRSLQRQSARLRVYQRLKQEENRLRLVELKQAYLQLNQQLNENERAIRKLEDDGAERAQQIRQLEEELHHLHSRLLDIQGERERALAELTQRRQQLNQLQSRQLMEQKEFEFLERSIAELVPEQTRLEQEITELQKVFATALNQLERANQELKRRQQELATIQNASRQQESALLAARQTEEQKQNQLRHLWEQEQQLRGKIIRLEAELANTRATATRIAEEQVRIERQLNQAETDRNSLQNEVNKMKPQLEHGRSQVTSRREELNSIEDRLAEISHRRPQLQEKRSRIAAEIARLETRISRQALTRAQEVFGTAKVNTVSHWLEPQPGWERACEAALNYLLDFLSIEGVEPERLEQLLNIAPAERFGFILNGPPKEELADASKLTPDPGIIGTLSQFVRLRTDAPPRLKSLLDSFLVIPDRQLFWSIITRYPDARFVTPDGYAYCGNSLLVIAGADAGTIPVLSKIRDLQHQTGQLAAELAGLEKTEVELKASRTTLLRELEKIESEVRLLEREYFTLESRLTTTASVAAELKRELDRLTAEHWRLGENINTLETELKRHQTELTAVNGEIERCQQELTALERQTSTAEQQIKNELKQASELLATLAEHRARVQHLETEISHLKGAIEEKSRRHQELTVLQQRQRARQQEIRTAQQQLAVAITELQEQLAAAERDFTQFNLNDVAAAAAELEKNLTELRTREQEEQNRLLEFRLQRAELESKLRALLDEAKSLGADPGLFTITEPSTGEAAEYPDEVQRLEEIRRRLAALGPVNPLAAEEYEQEKKDLERLIFQRDDVLTAKQNLEDSLREIDRHAREQFLSTYQEVRRHFQQVFSELFLEGEADLVLVNDANPLESEIAIIARPRGKNPKRLEQLSDGEKALLAVSLLFAFYRVKPAPFCFLDEIDAPLDDANVSRFADYLKKMAEKTQVVIITHNRATVERADVIFGITAEQPGVSKLLSVSLADYRTGNPAEKSPAN
ncbi:MAG: chromosome segregation protein SMC [candidate division WOR-3 bacterium]